jgi:trehalose 6-phosphate synthase/phosphatase
LGHLKNVGFSAEHGGFFRERGSKEWTNLTKSLDMSWMSEVEEIFKYYTEVCALFVFSLLIFGRFDVFLKKQRTTGSHIEVKKSSITWHYRGSDPEWG